MKYIDTDALLLPENYEEIEDIDFMENTVNGIGNRVKWYAELPQIPKPVRIYTENEIGVLEESMKKTGKL